MKWLIESFAYGMACLLRGLFFLPGIGRKLHNAILFYPSHLFDIDPKSADFPDLRKIVEKSFTGSAKSLEVQERIYNLSPRVRRQMTKNIVRANVWGKKIRAEAAKKGQCIPSHVMISPTYRCNLSCAGCYAKGREGDLPFAVWDKIIRDQEDLRIYNVTISGGEPFLREELLQILAYRKTNFTVFSNGTLVEERHVKKIAEFGNTRLVISLDGLRETNDRRRGASVFARASETLEWCREYNIPYGVSVTITRENLAEVTGDYFLQHLSKIGVYLVIFLSYLPIGPEGEQSLALSKGEFESLEKRCEFLSGEFPILFSFGRNGLSVTNCPAGSKRIHITAAGYVEPCIYCQMAADKITDKTIPEIMASDFFKFLRLLKESKEANLNPCMCPTEVYEITGARPSQ